MPLSSIPGSAHKRNIPQSQKPYFSILQMFVSLETQGQARPRPWADNPAGPISSLFPGGTHHRWLGDRWQVRPPELCVRFLWAGTCLLLGSGLLNSLEGCGSVQQLVSSRAGMQIRSGRCRRLLATVGGCPSTHPYPSCSQAWQCSGARRETYSISVGNSLDLLK